VVRRPVRLLLYVDNLGIGGAQHSTIDLAAGFARRGHHVVLASQLGPLAGLARERGLRVVLGPVTRHPRARAAASVWRAVGESRPDVVVAVGSAAALEALSGARGVPVVCGYPGDSLPPWVPRTPPLVAGQARVLDQATGRNPEVVRIGAAVDTGHNHPGIDGSGFRDEVGAGDGALGVLVSRLAPRQKPVGIELALAAAAELARRRPFLLVVVGDGRLRPEVEAAAGDAVRLVGALADPRPAYAAADVVLGLGTSLLRGMAHGRPAVALGVDGAAEAVGPSTLGGLSASGWFAAGDPVTPSGLADLVEAVLDDRRDLGALGRDAVVAERDAEVTAARWEPVLEAAAASPPSSAAVATDLARSWAGWYRQLGGDIARRRLGRWSRSPGSTTSS
jgi:glycosyltransferase involved in cell wall biosynthesis